MNSFFQCRQPNLQEESSQQKSVFELAFETKNEYYPLIFDAPTSSFGDYKTAQFLNLVFETQIRLIYIVNP
jgi:hypothetical protein